MKLYYEQGNLFYDGVIVDHMRNGVGKSFYEEAYIDTLKVHNPEFRVMTTDEIIREIKTDTQSALSAKTLFVFSLLGLMVMALTYSIFLTLIFRKILLKDYYPKE